jgi:hypothetical protein
MLGFYSEELLALQRIPKMEYSCLLSVAAYPVYLQTVSYLEAFFSTCNPMAYHGDKGPT